MKPECIKSYYDNGQVKIEDYYLNGELHREDGPAFILYHKNGKVEAKFYYLFGKETTEEELQKYLLVREIAGIS